MEVDPRALGSTWERLWAPLGRGYEGISSLSSTLSSSLVKIFENIRLMSTSEYYTAVKDEALEGLPWWCSG